MKLSLIGGLYYATAVYGTYNRSISLFVISINMITTLLNGIHVDDYMCNEFGDLGVSWNPNRPTTAIQVFQRTQTQSSDGIMI